MSFLLFVNLRTPDVRLFQNLFFFSRRQNLVMTIENSAQVKLRQHGEMSKIFNRLKIFFFV